MQTPLFGTKRSLVQIQSPRMLRGEVRSNFLKPAYVIPFEMGENGKPAIFFGGQTVADSLRLSSTFC